MTHNKNKEIQNSSLFSKWADILLHASMDMLRLYFEPLNAKGVQSVNTFSVLFFNISIHFFNTNN